MLTLKQVQDKCMFGKNAKQCRYLAEDTSGNFYCLKQTAERVLIDQEVDKFKKDSKDQGVDPYALSVPLGDNCKGYIFLRYKMQGYDL